MTYQQFSHFVLLSVPAVSRRRFAFRSCCAQIIFLWSGSQRRFGRYPRPLSPMRGTKGTRGERSAIGWTTVHSRSVRHPVPALRGRIDALTDHLVPAGRDGPWHRIVI